MTFIHVLGFVGVALMLFTVGSLVWLRFAPDDGRYPSGWRVGDDVQEPPRRRVGRHARTEKRNRTGEGRVRTAISSRSTTVQLPTLSSCRADGAETTAVCPPIPSLVVRSSKPPVHPGATADWSPRRDAERALADRSAEARLPETRAGRRVADEQLHEELAVIGRSYRTASDAAFADFWKLIGIDEAEWLAILAEHPAPGPHSDTELFDVTTLTDWLNDDDDDDDDDDDTQKESLKTAIALV